MTRFQKTLSENLSITYINTNRKSNFLSDIRSLIVKDFVVSDPTLSKAMLVLDLTGWWVNLARYNSNII